MTARGELDLPPVAFARAIDALRQAEVRSEVVLREVPAPQQVAPFAVALAAELAGRDTAEAHGRLVVLHDPAGQDGWDGTTRLVTFVSAALEPEMAVDPMLPDVAWQWLLEALAEHGATHTAAGGTVTRITSTRYGVLGGEPDDADVEIRASWSPLDDDLVPHLTGWCDLLCLAAGLPPPGVATLAHRRRQG